MLKLNSLIVPIPQGFTETDFSIKLGVFGVEMADFRTNCSIANQNCNPADYANYDGWMLGALVYVPLD